MTRDNKFTKDDLAQRCAWTIQDKIDHSRRMIRQWIDYWDEQGYGVYVSFSGGKDSTVLLDLVRSVDPSVPAVFSDTGLEFPEIKEFVGRFDNVDVVRPAMSFREVLLTYGYPVTIRRIAKMLRWHQNPCPENYASRMTTWTGINHGKYGKYAGKKTYGTGVLSLKYRYLIGFKLDAPGNCLACPLHLLRFRAGAGAEGDGDAPLHPPAPHAPQAVGLLHAPGGRRRPRDARGAPALGFRDGGLKWAS